MRALIGSKWAWLERRISELNKQICHLDYKIQRRPSKESSTFTLPRAGATPYLTLSNGGALLEQIHRPGGKPGNGLHSQFLPQLLLPGGISGTKLQVCWLPQYGVCFWLYHLEFCLSSVSLGQRLAGIFFVG